MPTEKPRYTITVDPEMQKAIEDYQFEQRFKSQTKAIISLMKIGLDVLQSEEKETLAEQESPKEPDYKLTGDEINLIESYRSLNEKGKEHIRICVASAQTLFKSADIDISRLERKA